LSFAAVLVGGAGLAGASVLVLLLLLGRLLRGLQSGLFLKNLLNRIRNLKTKPKN
jgi:ribose/xylose/arabinose/galactoside ABC-type transport system permease subunit